MGARLVSSVVVRIMCQCQILVMFAVVESFIHMWRTINAVETGKAGFQC